MPTPSPTEGSRRLADKLLAPSSRFRRYRWAVFVVASALELLLVLVVASGDSGLRPLDPVGAAVVFLSVLAAGLSGTVVGLGTALVAVAAAFSVLADFDDFAATSNAFASALLWCFAPIATGLTVEYLRRQVSSREDALQQALNRSLSARQHLERVLDFAPQFHIEGGVSAVTSVICRRAVETFGADSARLYGVEGGRLELLALCPGDDRICPGLMLELKNHPDIQEVLGSRRPSYERDVSHLPLRGLALHMQNALSVVSAVRMPIVGAGGVIGLLSLGWSHRVGRPSEELLAILQRFADQAAIAWQSALRNEAQQQADELRHTLDKVLALAPSFHIAGSRERVSEAICEAALETFDCTAAAVYRIEGNRMRLLARLPRNPSLAAGATFPLGAKSSLVQALRAKGPVFIHDVPGAGDLTHPWPEEVIRQAGTKSALYVPLRFNERGPRNLIVFAWDKPRDEPDANFMVVIQRFVDQAALALTNASARQLHARLEASLLPSLPTEHPDLRIFTRYHAGEQRLSLGGDFLGAANSEDGSLSFVIGDVSGHGPDAAALGATLRSTWKALALAGHGLPDILTVMRSVLLSEKEGENAYATIVAGIIDSQGRRLTLANAGHLPPVLIAEGDATPLKTPPVPPIGFSDPSRHPIVEFALPESWALVCYTDGLIDARLTPDSTERFGEERLLTRLRSWQPSDIGEASVDDLMRDIETGNGGPFADDVAVMVISTKSTAADVVPEFGDGATERTARADADARVSAGVSREPRGRQDPAGDT